MELSSGPDPAAIPRVTLEHLTFFHGFPKDMLAKMASMAVQECYPPGTALVKEGEPANRFFVIRDGMVTVSSQEDEDATPIQSLGVGEVVGWSWMSAPYIWTFDVNARTETTVLAFDAERLRALCDEHPEWGYVLMKSLACVFALRLKHMRELWRAERLSVMPPH